MHKSSSLAGSNGDWICPSPKCANMNFARRSVCNRCGEQRPIQGGSAKKVGVEIGKSAAEKSNGLFSADDWQCGKCGNVNWARRSTCNVCNAPRLAEPEERTGLGGGFNERDGVEYIQRDDSENEYDDFGRKKKPYRGDVQSSGVKQKSVSVKQKADKAADESNSDDSEVDEDDLSKYDLSGWGDDEDNSSTKKSSTSTSDAKKKSSADSHKSGRRRHSPSSSSSSSASSSRSRRHRRSRSSSSSSSSSGSTSSSSSDYSTRSSSRDRRRPASKRSRRDSGDRCRSRNRR